MKKLFAEFFGTYWLIFGGCGSAIFSAGIPNFGIGIIGVALAFGFTVLTMVYAVGSISGGHFNPAVSIGLWAADRFPTKDLMPYIFSQCIGAIAAAATLYIVALGKSDFIIDNTKPGAFASNGFGDFSPNGYSIEAAFITEFILTLFLLLIILGTTRKFSGRRFAGIAIGLGLTVIHLISIPITNTSVNPARSLSQALFVGGKPLMQVWLFWLAPILGGITAGYIHKKLLLF